MAIVFAVWLQLLTPDAGPAGPSAAVVAGLPQSPPCTTPAARQFCAWLEAFNSGQPETLRQFFEASLPERLPKIDQEIALQRGTGGFRLDRVEADRPEQFTALIVERNTGLQVRCLFEVDLRTPNHVSRMDLQAVQPSSWAGSWKGVLTKDPATPGAPVVDVTMDLGPFPSADAECSPWRTTYSEGGVVRQVKDYKLCRGTGAADLYIDEGGVKLTARWMGDMLVSPFKGQLLARRQLANAR